MANYVVNNNVNSECDNSDFREKYVFTITDGDLLTSTNKLYENNKAQDGNKEKTVRKFPRRYVTCALTSIGMMIASSLKLNLSIAVVAMTNERLIFLENGTYIQQTDFNWTSHQKGLVLGSFFYGYVLSELPIGWLSGKYGGVTTLGASITCSALLSFVIPIVAKCGVFYIIVFRALVGIVEGGTFPSVQAIWSKWAPPEEKTMLVTISYTGIHAAQVLCSPIFGFLAGKFGWQSLFYVPGSWAIIWSILWFVNIKNDPIDDPKITTDELQKLKTISTVVKNKKINYPWKEIFTSVPIWMIIVTYFSIMWAYTTMVTYLPTVLNDIWHIDLETIGILVSLPHIGPTVVTPIVGILSDYLRNRKKINTTTVRKLCQSISGFGTALFVFLAAFSNSSTMAVLCFVMMMCCEPFCFGSFIINCLDISPVHSGVIMGIASTVATSAGVFCCLVAAEITSHKTKTEWCIVFSISSLMCVVSTILYLLFASGKLQPWAENNENNKTSIQAGSS